MNKLLLLVLPALWLLPTTVVHAQFDEAGIFFGISHYSGDLTERLIEPLEFNHAWGFYARRKISERLGMKYQFTKGKLSGSDANSSVESGLWRRNLHFESDVYELAAIAEYQFVKIKKGEYGISPYLYGGLAVFHFTPFTEMNGKSYDLHYYKTEGVEYSLVQMAIPFGAGLKLQVNGTGTLGLEAGLRKTFTDYLDDVSGFYPTDLVAYSDGENPSVRTLLSYRAREADPGAAKLPSPGGQRGNPDKNDWYLFFGVTLGVCLK